MSQTVRLGPAEIDALARIAYAEAEVDGVEGMQAVVATVLNRAATGRRDFGGSSIIDVLNHRGQFTPVTRAGSVDRLPLAPESVERMVAEFVASFSPATDPTSGATFFNSDGSNRFPSHLTIGGHTFHRGYNDQRVTVPTYTPELAEPVRTAYNIAAPARTAQATQVPATGPILTDETSLLTPYADGGTARLSQIAGMIPPSRPTDLAARPDIRNRTPAGYDASLGQRGDVAQLQRGPELPGVRQAQLEYDNRGATRNQRLDPVLEARIAEAVGAVYGPDARAVVYSGGQPEGRPRPRGASPRHDDGLAADVKVFDADGNQIRGDRLGSLGQYWGAQGFGSVGMEMSTGGIHLDAHNANPERLIPGAMAAYGSPSWDYSQRGGSVTPGQLAAMERGFAGEMPRVYAATPPSPAQAVAARARNPANMTAFVEPPEPAHRQTRVAAAAPVTMTDASPMSGGPYQSRTGRPNADVLRSAGIPVTGTPDVDAAATFILENPPAQRPTPATVIFDNPVTDPSVARTLSAVQRPSAGRADTIVGRVAAAPPESLSVIEAPYNPNYTLGALSRSSTPRADAVLSRSADVGRPELSYAPDVARASARQTFPGATGLPSVATRDVTRIGASAPRVDMSPLAPPSVARSARALIDFPNVGMPAPRSVRTTNVGPVPGTIAGALPAPAAPPSRPVAPSAPPPRPAPAPALASAPLPPERPAFIANNPNAPRPVQMFERGVAGIGNFVERNTRGIRSSLNDRYGDYYGGDMFAYTPQSYGGQDALSFANMDAAMRGPGAPGLFDMYDRQFGGMSRGGSTAGAIIGGMFGGPIGGLVGGLTGGIAGEAMGFGRREARDGAGNIIDPQSGNIFSRVGDFLGNVFDGGGQASSGGNSAAASGAPVGNPGGLGGMGGMQSDPFGNDISTLYN